MCGIIGGWCTERIASSAINASLNALVHRGPDDSGTLLHGSVFLAMRRLAIIDVSGGRQPIFNEQRNTAAVCNGEIYNYRELTGELISQGHQFATESDTEVLVHLYEQHGEKLCEHLRGMYSFALWDSRRRLLLLGRDRFGKKPLYYTRTRSGGLLFASELKALKPLVDAAGGEWSIREQGIYDYLSLGCVPQPETAFDGVYAVPPASTLRFDCEELKIEPYWKLEQRTKAAIPYEDALWATRSHVAEAVRLRLRSDVPLGVFLSGGVDSSVVAYEAARVVGENLQTFTIAMDESRFDESAVAGRTAESLGVRNTVLPLRVAPLQTLLSLVRRYDQPFADPSAIPSLAVSELARQRVTVILNGDGGDEVFAGYRRHMAAHLSGVLGPLPWAVTAFSGWILGLLARERRSVLGFAARLARGLAQKPGARYLTWTSDRMQERDKRSIWQGDRMRPTEEWIESIQPAGLSGLDTQIATDIRVNLLSQLLVKMDIATMAHSLEGRSPLLDHKLAEFLATMPDRHRLRRGQLKSLLRDAYRGLLPGEVITGRKRGFEVPLSSWLENDLRELLMDTVGSPQARVRDYLDGSFLDALLAGKVLRDRNWATLVYSLLVLELWIDISLSNRSVDGVGAIKWKPLGAPDETLAAPSGELPFAPTHGLLQFPAWEGERLS